MEMRYILYIYIRGLFTKQKQTGMYIDAFTWHSQNVCTHHGFVLAGPDGNGSFVAPFLYVCLIEAENHVVHAVPCIILIK